MHFTRDYKFARALQTDSKMTKQFVSNVLEDMFDRLLPIVNTHVERSPVPTVFAIKVEVTLKEE